MSGGSWDYLHSKMEYAADRLTKDEMPERRALGRMMERMAKAMHAIEWVDSCDWAKGDEVAPIEEALGPAAAALTLAELETTINAAHARALDLIARHRREVL